MNAIGHSRPGWRGGAAGILTLFAVILLQLAAQAADSGSEVAKSGAVPQSLAQDEGGLPLQHRFLAVDDGTHTLVYVDEKDPARNWTTDTGFAMDLQMLSNDRVLLDVDDGFREYDVRTGKLLATVKGHGGRAFSVRRLSDGRTILLGDSLEGQKGPCLAVYNRAGEVTERKQFEGLGMIRHLRPTLKGTFLLAAVGQVVEVDSKWDIVWRAKVEGNLFKALPLPNGNVLCSSGPGGRFVKAIDRHGTVVWQLRGDNLSEGSFTGFELLPDGHLVVANWLGHGPNHDGTVLVEFDRAGKIVWRYARPHASFVEVLVLDQEGAN